MKVFKLLALMLLFVVVFSTCKKEEELPKSRTIHIKGRIKDTKGNPIKDVKVVVGELECRINEYTPNFQTNLTITTFTDSLGNFTLDYFDKNPPLPYTEENASYNCHYDDYIWVFKDGYHIAGNDYLPIADIVKNEFIDTAIVLHKYSWLKLVLNPVSSANGISIHTDYPIVIDYTSNLYANRVDGCRVDSPRKAEFLINTIPDWNFEINTKLFPGGDCKYLEGSRKIHTNSENSTDTLIYKLDY